MIQHYFKMALRQLLKYKSQNLISILGLSVGLFCFSVCFYASRFMGSVDQCFEHHSQLIELALIDSDGEAFSGTPHSLLKTLKQRQWRSVEAMTAVGFRRERPYNIQISEQKHLPYKLYTMEVDSLYERMFTPSVVAGSWTIAVHTPNAAILTESKARTMFADLSEAIGKQMVLTNRLSTSPPSTPQAGGIAYTIQAIIKDLPPNASMHFMKQVDLLTMNDSEGGFQMKGDNFTGADTYALLKKGSTIKEFEKEIRDSQLTVALFGGKSQIQTLPIGEREDVKQMTTIFGLFTGSIGLLVLLVGLLNFYHFQSGCFLNRNREFSLRKVLGNNSVGLFSMQFVQMGIVLFLAILLSACLIELFSPALQLSLFGFNLQIEKATLLKQLSEYLIYLLLLSALICVGTTLYIRRSSIQVSLHGGVRRTGKKRLRNALLGVQFFICWLFVSLTLALYLQSQKTSDSLYETLSRKEKEEIFGIGLNYTFMNREEKLALIDRFQNYSGVKEVLPADIAFTRGISGNGIYSEKEGRDSYIDVGATVIPKGFVSFMNIKLSAGRNIQTESEILVSRGFAEHQKKEVLGATYCDWKKNSFTVVGIVDVFSTYIYNDGFGQQFKNRVYFPYKSNDYVGHCYLKSQPGRENEVRKWVYKELRNALPESVEPEIQTLQDEIELSQEFENKLKSIILSLAVVCLIITLLGVYSAITLDTERRQKEVAIRKVNGAGTKAIFLLFARLYAWLLGISFLCALPLLLLIIGEWKKMYTVFFDCGIVYWLSILIAVVLLTTLTVAFRIRRIAAVHPAEVIKSE